MAVSGAEQGDSVDHSRSVSDGVTTYKNQL